MPGWMTSIDLIFNQIRNHMVGFGLLVGHLLGDYILQNDWQARCKVAWPPTGERPANHLKASNEWDEQNANAKQGHLACTVHCLLYTLAIWACSFWWMPWWGLVTCFVIHWPVDRFRLARRWMFSVSGQSAFATGPLSPWSIIVVDNTFHLLTLFVIGMVSGA